MADQAVQDDVSAAGGNTKNDVIFQIFMMLNNGYGMLSFCLNTFDVF